DPLRRCDYKPFSGRRSVDRNDVAARPIRNEQDIDRSRRRNSSKAKQHHNDRPRWTEEQATNEQSPATTRQGKIGRLQERAHCAAAVEGSVVFHLQREASSLA